MRNFPILMTVSCLAFVTGCVRTYSMVDKVNGIETSKVEGSVGFRSSESLNETNDQLMPACVAHVGKLPDGLEEPLCVRKTIQDLQREQMMLDMNAMPYYDPYMPMYGQPTYTYPPSRVVYVR